jgi:hypothetical protein
VKVDVFTSEVHEIYLPCDERDGGCWWGLEGVEGSVEMSQFTHLLVILLDSQLGEGGGAYFRSARYRVRVSDFDTYLH